MADWHGVGSGGAGPLFGGGNKGSAQAGNMAANNPMEMAKQMGLDAENLPNAEEMQKKMQELEKTLPKQFKTRF